jgi:hypothetical protein|nr:MAG TPA: hypothetical protein [Crassvirales sp.]
MEQPLDKIRRLSKSLPERDIKFAEKYIASREFDKLLEIVESDIYMVQQNELLEHPKEKFANINLEELLELRGAIDEYMSFLEVPDNSDDDSWMYD